MMICRVCKLEKDEDDFFYGSYVRKDGTRSRKSACKSCTIKAGKEWRANHRWRKHE